VCCSVLQCVVVCCSALQCVAVCCSVLQRVAVRCRQDDSFLPQLVRAHARTHSFTMRVRTLSHSHSLTLYDRRALFLVKWVTFFNSLSLTYTHTHTHTPTHPHPHPPTPSWYQMSLPPPLPLSPSPYASKAKLQTANPLYSCVDGCGCGCVGVCMCVCVYVREREWKNSHSRVLLQATLQTANPLHFERPPPQRRPNGYTRPTHVCFLCCSSRLHFDSSNALNCTCQCNLLMYNWYLHIYTFHQISMKFSLKAQVSFRKIANNCRALLQKMTY